MTDYIRKIQRQLVSHYGFDERPDAPGIPVAVPDGEYPMMIDGKLDRVRIQDGTIHCCNFEAEARSPKLEDLFAGVLELTATERAYLRHALVEHYMRGGWCPKDENRRDFNKRILNKLGTLKLSRMVSPDGMRLVAVEEHDAIVVDLHVTKKRSWQVVHHSNGVTWFWSAAGEDSFGSVVLEAEQWVANTARGWARFSSLDDAKNFVEEHSS